MYAGLSGVKTKAPKFLIRFSSFLSSNWLSTCTLSVLPGRTFIFCGCHSQDLIKIQKKKGNGKEIWPKKGKDRKFGLIKVVNWIEEHVGHYGSLKIF